MTKVDKTAETFTVTVTYSTTVKASGATPADRMKAAEDIAGYNLTKKIGCKFISAKAIPVAKEK